MEETTCPKRRKMDVVTKKIIQASSGLLTIVTYINATTKCITPLPLLDSDAAPPTLLT